MSDLTDAQTRLALVLAAYDDALAGKTVQYGDMQITRQNINQLADEITRLRRRVDTLNAQAAGAKSPGISIPKWT